MWAIMLKYNKSTRTDVKRGRKENAMKMTFNHNRVDANEALRAEQDFRFGIAQRLASLNTSKIKDLNGLTYREEIKFPEVLNDGKVVVPSWLAKAPIKMLRQRMDEIDQAREEYIEALELAGFAKTTKEYSVDGITKTLYGVEKGGEFYTFSAVSYLDNGELKYDSKYSLISTWIKDNIKDLDDPIQVAASKFMGSHWCSRSYTFESLGGVENIAVAIQPGMTLEESRCLYHFMTSMTRVNSERELMISDYKTLNQLLSGKGGVSIKELTTLGLLEVAPSEERSKESEERKQFLLTLSPEALSMYYISRKIIKTFLTQYDQYILETYPIYDYKVSATWEELAFELKSLKGEYKKDVNGNKMAIMDEDGEFKRDANGDVMYKKINAWTLWELMLPYYVSGAVAGGDLATAFFNYSAKAASYGHDNLEQAAFQFESWAKQRLERMEEYVQGNPEKDLPAHTNQTDFLVAFKNRLVEDEII